MNSRRILFLLFVLVLVVGPAAAQEDGPEPQATDAFWQGEYWNNPTLSGEPVLRRADPMLNFSWGRGAAAEGLPSDQFSARWQRYIYVPEIALYHFAATSDDGLRVWVDDVLLIDEWEEQAASQYSAEIYLDGWTPVRMDYFEKAGLARAELRWTRLE